MHINASHQHDNDSQNTNKFTCTTTVNPDEVVEVEAFFYIVVVIAFYSTTIVFLLIKYARNEHDDQSSKYNYSEFVNREKFQTARYKNKIALERTKTILGNLNISETMKIAVGTACPVIIVSEYPEMVERGGGTNDTALECSEAAADVESSTTSQISFEECDMVPNDVDASLYFDATNDYMDCVGVHTHNLERRISCETI